MSVRADSCPPILGPAATSARPAAVLLILGLLLIAGVASAQEAPAPDGEEAASSSAPAFDPLFLGYGSEPEMLFGGRTVVSLQVLGSRGLSRLFRGERHPGVAPAWEFPLAAAVLLVQHEVGGHGGRAREFGLSPSYSFNYDFSGGTSIERTPRTNEEGSLLAAGGMEADQVLSHDVLLDLLRPGGADGAKIPLAFMTKLDLTLYVAQTVRPERRPGSDREDFIQQFVDGNDVANWIVSRQADRLGADPASVWERRYGIDFTDPLLEDNWNDARATALWNLADPALVAAVFAYFRGHVVHGERRVEMPRLRLANGWGLMLGTRGALGPREVSRYLDLHAATPRGVWTIYVRDLDSSVDRTFGAGAAVRALPLGRYGLSFAADAWREPEGAEPSRRDSGWNVEGDLDAPLGTTWGLAARLGAKSAGFLPGHPLEDGPYLGLGLTAAW